jgi:hypothetical protein
MSPLSALNSLRQLFFDMTKSSIAAGLTQLTSLSIVGDRETVPQCLGHIISCTQLQDLQLETEDDPFITPEQITRILTSCKQLTSLTVDYPLFQAEFDALLTHGPQLTRLTCGDLHLTEDRSATPCSLKELVMMTEDPNAETLAYIPTASLTRLAFLGDAVLPSPCPTLEFVPRKRSVPANMPELVRRSLVNLMRCPAWQQCGPRVHVRLSTRRGRDMPELLSLIPALAPLASKEVKLSIDMEGGDVGASELQQLGFALGSSLTQLVLGECDLSPDFWPAVWAHLPGLQQVTVGSRVRGANVLHELASFCSCATRPLQLRLGQRLYTQVEGRLDQEGRWMGVPHVTVTEAVDI